MSTSRRRNIERYRRSSIRPSWSAARNSQSTPPSREWKAGLGEETLPDLGPTLGCPIQRQVRVLGQRWTEHPNALVPSAFQREGDAPFGELDGVLVRSHDR